MATTGFPGPISVEGLKPPMQGPTPYVGGPAAIGIPESGEFGPSLFWAGIGIRDLQYMQRIGAGPLSPGGYANQDVGFYAGANILGIDQVPAAVVAGNIAAAANATSGSSMALAAASTGITVLSAALTILPTGNIVPSGCLVIDSNPAWVGAGPAGAFAWLDPRHSIARALSITGAAGGAGGVFNIVGYDIFGWRMTQQVTATTGATTVNTLKAFKFVQSVTPAFADAHTYAIATTDIIGMPVRTDRFAYLDLTWATGAASQVTSDVGFVAADATSPATNLTGDVRGTWLLTSGTGSNGTRVLTIFCNPSFANMVVPTTYAAARAGLLGQPQV